MTAETRQRLREEAAQWCARMMRSDADLHRAAFDAWLRADASHRSAYDRVQGRYDRAGVLAWSSLRASPRRSHARHWTKAVGLGAIGIAGGLAAAALMLTTLSTAITRLSGPDQQQVAAQSAPTGSTTPYAISAHVGEIRSITLPDGSKVVLDTTARLVVAFGNRERRLSLSRGRARFEVAHEARPFVVTAGNGQITARGTIFDVEARDHGRVQVTLLRGAIDVSVRAGRNDPPVMRRLQANQSTVFDQIGFAAPTQPAPVAIADWPSGVMDAEAMPLADLLNQANRYSAVPLAPDTADLGSLKVSGRFRVDQPDLLARNLADLFGLTVDRTDPGKIVLARKM